MNKVQTDLLRSALRLLRRLVPNDDEPEAVDSAPRRGPVAQFAKKFLVRDPASTLSSAELWTFFDEITTAGELESLSKSQFLRQLPHVLELTFGVKKCHNIERHGHHVRGFKGINLNEQA